MKKIAITGASGFIGRNLRAELGRFADDYELFLIDIDTDERTLKGCLSRCDAVVHLAGVNRPKNEDEFKTGNVDFTNEVLSALCELKNPVPVIMTSSIQAALENPYGVSKLQSEQVAFAYSRAQKVPVYIFRLPNVFGKWCRPNYNSAVATFCGNIANGLPIEVNAPERVMTLVYIDDVIASIIDAINGKISPAEDGYCHVPVTYEAKLQEIADKIQAFHNSRETLVMPTLTGLDKALYSTYLSYLPTNAFSYPLTVHADARGLFAEFFKTEANGQFSISTTAPGITRGNHWHHTKVEKFLVIHGEASICFRKVDESAVYEYKVSGTKPTVVDIPAGYTHSIKNISNSRELITIIWANEPFDPECPDTYQLEV